MALIIFTYLFGKRLDNSKDSYLRLSIILVVAIYIFKVNTFGLMLFIVSFIEGIFVKMYELSINTQFYKLSKKFEYSNYNLVYEIIQNSFRSFVVFILLLSSFDLKTMIYIRLVVLF